MIAFVQKWAHTVRPYDNLYDNIIINYQLSILHHECSVDLHLKIKSEESRRALAE